MLVRTIFKLFQFSRILLFSKISTIILRIILWINEVDFGTGVKTMKSIPDLVINRNSGVVKIGDNVVFNNYADHSWNSKCKIIVRPDASLRIGDNVGMNGVMIYCSNNVYIGNNTKLGGGTRVFDTNHHSMDYMERRTPETDIPKSSPIVIEDDVFIGAGCYIQKGVTIGARSIIAAGSVVVKSIPSDCLAGGNPCKVIKELNQN